MAAASAALPASVTVGRSWFTLLLNEQSAKIADKHVPMYIAKGLLSKHATLAAAAAAMGVPVEALVTTLAAYNSAAASK